MSYVPDPLGSFLDRFRQWLGGSEQTQAHITILPPRPLQVPLGIASEHASEILQQFAPFAVELDSVHRFPLTNVLYLDLANGQQHVRELHNLLNAGELAHREEFEFHPHLTLGGPLDDAVVAQSQADTLHEWMKVQLSKRFVVDEVVALWSSPETSSQDDWARVWTYNFREGMLRQTTAASSSTG